jgi:hypothetical protein
MPAKTTPKREVSEATRRKMSEAAKRRHANSDLLREAIDMDRAEQRHTKPFVGLVLVLMAVGALTVVWALGSFIGWLLGLI